MIVEENRDELLDDICARIQRIDEGLGCEVGGRNDPPELIVVSYSDAELFPLVDRIVAAAPDLLDWRVQALVPPRGFDFKINWSGVEICCDELVFNPLQSAVPGSLGIALYLPDAIFEIEGAPYQAAWRIIETGLGERETALKIQHVQAEPISSDDLTDFIKLSQLQDYVAWHDRKYGR